MSDNDYYFFFVDNIFDMLNMKKPKTADEALDMMNDIKFSIEQKIDTALDDIFEDYCEEKNLKWEDEE